MSDPSIAVVQFPSVLGDRDASLARAVALAEDAADAGAALVVFPEAFVPGYPTWAWRLRPGADMELAQRIHERLLANAIDLSRDDALAPLRDVARRRGLHITCGVDEIDGVAGGGTLYNSYVHATEDGEIANVHRKLMPTNPERMVWGLGDGRGLRVVETPVGRVGALICWEARMPMARMSLYAQGLDVLLAPTWDSSAGWTGSMQHIAREGGCYVVSCCSAMVGADVPEDFPGRSRLFPYDDETINRGRSCVVAPGGELLVPPRDRERTVLYAAVDPSRARAARRSFDVAGHYARPDIFELRVRREPLSPVSFAAP